MRQDFPDAVSYNRFVELMPRVFFKMMLFMKLYAFGKCTGITFVDSTMIPVCHNVRRYYNKVFAGLAKDGKGTMGWCHGFKLHLLCNDSGEVITFCLTGANVDDRDSRVWTVFAKVLFGKVFADRGYIKQELFESCSVKVSNSFMGSRLRWRTNWCLCGTRSCWGKDTSSSALTNYSRTKPTLFTQDTARYTTLSWTCVLPLQHTASLRTSQRHCQCMWKNQGSWNFFHTKLIPNSSINWIENVSNINCVISGLTIDLGLKSWV